MALVRNAPSNTMPADFINLLSGAYIDRVAERRKDAAWLEQALADPGSLFVPVWRGRNLLSRTSSGLTALLVERSQDIHLMLREQARQQVFLGLYGERACFALEIDAASAPPVVPDADFQDIRTLLGALDRNQAGLLAYARALITWAEKHRYCGACGAPTIATQGGHAMKCNNASCGLEIFPRIDPAIIVLITDGERVLLGRQAAWRPGWYSTIAGFVEAGESLEDAVRREVLEETGVHVKHIQYHSSQPWPFPQSLMLGFIAQADSTDIALHDTELEDARWFTRADIASGTPMTPPPISISGCLIAHWYDAGAIRPLREEPAARSWNAR